MEENSRLLAEESDKASADALVKENPAILQREQQVLEQRESLIKPKVTEIPVPETFVEELEIPTNSFCVTSVFDPIEKLSCYTNGCAVLVINIENIGNVVMHIQNLAEDELIDEMIQQSSTALMGKLGINILNTTPKLLLANPNLLNHLNKLNKMGTFPNFSEDPSIGSRVFIDNVNCETYSA